MTLFNLILSTLLYLINLLCVSRTCFILFLLYFILDLSHLFIDSVYLFFLVFHLIHVAFFGVFKLRFFEHIGPLVYLKLSPPTLSHLFLWNTRLRFYLTVHRSWSISFSFSISTFLYPYLNLYTCYILYIFGFRALAFFLFSCGWCESTLEIILEIFLATSTPAKRKYENFVGNDVVVWMICLEILLCLFR